MTPELEALGRRAVGVPKSGNDCPDGSNLVGILFSDPMVRAIAENRKTVTRRESERWMRLRKGDRLWVRECFYFTGNMDGHLTREDGSLTDEVTEAGVRYRADPDSHRPECGRIGWRSSRIMPFTASRFMLRLTEDPRREPVRDITYEEVIREGAWLDFGWSMGFPIENTITAEECFRATWEHLHPGTWETSCPVRLAFEVMR